MTLALDRFRRAQAIGRFLETGIEFILQFELDCGMNQDESTDVRALVVAIHQDRQASKDKERREAWTKYVSLMVVALAVLTAMASLKSGSFGSRVLLNQARASDTWAFYQSKSIKRHLAEMESRQALNAEAQKVAREELERYRKEEIDVKSKAEEYEKTRDESSRHGPPLAFGIAMLQISIALASVCLITKRRLLWAAAAVLGTSGACYAAYGVYFL
jgi:hypothetical protein